MVTPDPDTEKVEEALAVVVEARKQNEATNVVADLETSILRLSSILVDSAMAMLESIGFSTLLFRKDFERTGVANLHRSPHP